MEHNVNITKIYNALSTYQFNRTDVTPDNTLFFQQKKIWQFSYYFL